MESSPSKGDLELLHVHSRLKAADPDGMRAAKVFRRTFDQLYDGQRTGRYSWDQLSKTEKTHFGTLVEINLRREFDDLLADGRILDYAIDGIEIDCKYSFSMYQWMIPPEAHGHLLLVATASDEQSEFALGVVRASAEHLRLSSNRDGKTSLNPAGRAAVEWLHFGASLPPNVLLQLTPEERARIFSDRSGQQRVNELLRVAEGRRISRNVIATVAQQDDFMKRVRANGGARSALAAENYLILGGDYSDQRQTALALGCVVPEPGEVVSVRVEPAELADPNTVVLNGGLWHLAE